ncbi:MAG: site-specific integrase, partial [Tannerellaceae bacterium]|nr:site-specific integrase [Tannerellaceae bacterium]
MQPGKDIIAKYKTYLRLEKSLSPHSVEAYLTDLNKLLRFMEGEGLGYAGITYMNLQQFVAQLHDLGIHPRSQARIISGIRSFYRFLLLEGRSEEH